MSWLRLVRWELHKVVRRRSSYVGFAVCAAFCVVVMIVFGYSQFRALSKHSAGILANPLDYVNGYFFSSVILYFGDKALLPLLAVIVAGSQLAGEAKEGTLRLLLVRPPSRPAVFLAKALVSYLWLLAAVYFLIFLSLLVGLIALGGGDFLVFIWEFRREGPWLAGPGDWLPIFLLTGLGASLGLAMFVALALMLSALTDNPVVAHVGALGVFFISSVVQRLPEQLLHPSVQQLMPTSHASFWHEIYWLFHADPARFHGGRFWGDIKWCALYTVVFLAVGLVVFTRKDIRS